VLDHLNGLYIHTLDQPPTEEAAAALAYAGAVSVQHRWRSHLALGLQPLAEPDASGFTTVCVALVFPGGDRRAIHRYDVQQAEGWEVLGTLALDLLRRYLLEPPA
jgi:hypothetical protein